MELADKVVFMSGASSGIGLEVGRLLIESGSRVVFAARSGEVLRREVERATAAGGRALAVELDVTSSASVARAVSAAIDHFGRIDILVNNAGNGGNVRLWSATDPELMMQMFDVHVLGAERMMRAVVPTMRTQAGGIILNIASTVAWVPMPGAAAYSSAKAAVVALSATLRAELAGDGIDVRVFSPPHTSTQAGRAWPLDLPRIFAPDWVAKELVQSLRGGRARVTPGGNGMLLLLQRMSPAIAAGIMNRLGFRAIETARTAVDSLPTS
jgi:NAD(P)-dependent dehydrogenase (short-subunit alcohol dehydrogenase family)